MEDIFLRREKKDCNFVVIPNKLLRDKKISLSAKGLLCYMLSCKDDWKFTVKGLSTVTGETTYKINKALDELEKEGYHKKEAVRDNGKIVSWKYYVADYPAFIGQKSDEIPKEKTTYEKCTDVINREFIDDDVKIDLFNYLTVRIRLGGLTEKLFTSIVLELRELAQTKEEAEEIVQTATKNQWRKFYPVKKSYKKKNTFVDDITPVLTDDVEGLLRQKYLEEFSMIPKCDRPSFEEWRETQ